MSNVVPLRPQGEQHGRPTRPTRPTQPARSRSSQRDDRDMGGSQPDLPAATPLWRHMLGQQLRTERHARQARISDIAERAGVSPQYVSEIERGLKDPSSEILDALAGALDLPVADLVGRAARHLKAIRTGPGTTQCLAA